MEVETNGSSEKKKVTFGGTSFNDGQPHCSRTLDFSADSDLDPEDTIVRRRMKRPVTPKRDIAPVLYGQISGVPPGTIFSTKDELRSSRVHIPVVLHYSWTRGQGIASILLDKQLCYTDEGSLVLLYGYKDTKKVKKNNNINSGFTANVQSHNFVRVIRSYDSESFHKPKNGYRYDGLYSVKLVLMQGLTNYLLTIKTDGVDPPPNFPKSPNCHLLLTLLRTKSERLRTIEKRIKMERIVKEESDDEENCNNECKVEDINNQIALETVYVYSDETDVYMEKSPSPETESNSDDIVHDPLADEEDSSFSGMVYGHLAESHSYLNNHCDRDPLLLNNPDLDMDCSSEVLETVNGLSPQVPSDLTNSNPRVSSDGYFINNFLPDSSQNIINENFPNCKDHSSAEFFNDSDSEDEDKRCASDNKKENIKLINKEKECILNGSFISVINKIAANKYVYCPTVSKDPEITKIVEFIKLVYSGKKRNRCALPKFENESIMELTNLLRNGEHDTTSTENTMTKEGRKPDVIDLTEDIVPPSSSSLNLKRLQSYSSTTVSNSNKNLIKCHPKAHWKSRLERQITEKCFGFSLCKAREEKRLSELHKIYKIIFLPDKSMDNCDSMISSPPELLPELIIS